MLPINSIGIIYSGLVTFHVIRGPSLRASAHSLLSNLAESSLSFFSFFFQAMLLP